MVERILRRLDPQTLKIVDEFRREPNSRISALARRLGLRVRLADLEDGNSGQLVLDKEAPSGYAIEVNRADTVERQRWTTAHEIGHYLLHLRSEDHFPTASVKHRHADILMHIYFDDEKKEEAEANAFAEAVLIPLSMLKNAVKKGEVQKERIAKIFNVSHDVAQIALHRLHRISLRNKS